MYIKLGDMYEGEKIIMAFNQMGGCISLSEILRLKIRIAFPQNKDCYDLKAKQFIKIKDEIIEIIISAEEFTRKYWLIGKKIWQVTWNYPKIKFYLNPEKKSRYLELLTETYLPPEFMSADQQVVIVATTKDIAKIIGDKIADYLK